MATPWRTNNNFYRRYLYNFVLLYKKRADLKMFLEIILSLVTIIIFGIFAVRPTFVTIASLITEINSKVDISQQLDQKIANIGTAQTLVDQNREKIDRLNIAIPDSPTPQTYIRQIEGLVTKNSVLLEQLRMEDIALVGQEATDETLPTEPIDETETITSLVLPPTAAEINISLSVSGSYLSLLSFLKDVQNTRRPLVIDTFLVNSVIENRGQKLVLTINGRIPYIE